MNMPMKLLVVLALSASASQYCQATVPPLVPSTVPSQDDIEEISVDEIEEAKDDAEALTGTPEDIRARLAAGKPAPGSADPAPADPSLLPVFKDFGEMPGLVALMDDFMVILLADPRTQPFFAEADQAGVKRMLAEQFCVILGGSCTYSGRDMKTTHAGLGIERKHFNALVEDLQVAMNKRGIPFRSQNRLLAKLAPMHREVQDK